MAAHKYRVLRTCYWNLILWEPEKMKDPIVEIDPEVQGIPPYHFEPLDGGPVGPTPVPRSGAAPRLDLPRPPAPLDEPVTLKGLQDATLGQEPKFVDHDAPTHAGGSTSGGPAAKPAPDVQKPKTKS